MAYYMQSFDDGETVTAEDDVVFTTGLKEGETRPDPTGGSYRVCVDCGFHFHLTKDECDYFKSKGFELPKRCKSCRQKRKGVTSVLSAIGSIQKCIDCGEDFELTATELDFYSRNGLKLPKRCKECRKKRKEQKESAKRQEK